MNEAIEAEVKPLAIRDEVSPQALALLDANTPEEFLERLERVSKPVVDFIRKRGLAKKLGQGDREHVFLEGWQFLGALPWIRVYAVIEWTKEVGDGQGWEARAVAYRDGLVVGAGEGMCLRAEYGKGKKDYFSLRSQAQTRAMSRALQGPLRFVMVAAGFSGTGAEDMPRDAAPPPPPPQESVELRRRQGLARIHSFQDNNKVSDKDYRKLLIELFGDECYDAQGQASSSMLSLPDLQTFYMELKRRFSKDEKK